MGSKMDLQRLSISIPSIEILEPTIENEKEDVKQLAPTFPLEATSSFSYCNCPPHPQALQWLSNLARREGWAKESEEKKQRTLRIFAGTFNVAGHFVDCIADLAEWLDIAVYDGQPPPDLFIIGFQEVIDLSASNVVVDSFLDNNSRANAFRWLNNVLEYLGSYGRKHNIEYNLVSDERLLGTYIIVMAETSLSKLICSVQRGFVPLGMGGTLGNKGAVAVRLVIAKEISLCAVCCHLAAHRENELQRNDECMNISKRRLFSAQNANYREEANTLPSQTSVRMGGLFNLSGYASAAVAAAAGYGPTEIPRKLEDLGRGVNDHDVVIWVGDMNYRIRTTKSSEEVVQLIKNGELDELMELDQLCLSMKEGKVFQDFYEGKLNFPPTYKLTPGTRDYDMRPDKKMRCPAWCDRILWSVNPSSESGVRRMSLERYWSSGPYISDHTPVNALFSVSISYSDPNLSRTMSEKLMREWQIWRDSELKRETITLQSIPMHQNGFVNGDSSSNTIAHSLALQLSKTVEAAPPALTARGIERNSMIEFTLYLILLRSQLGPELKEIAVACELGYHVCPSSCPSWIRLTDSAGILGDKPEDGQIKAEIDASLIAFERSNECYLPACAMLVISITAKESNEVIRQLVVPVVCTLKD